MVQRSNRTSCKVEENKKSESERGTETFLADREEAIDHWSFLNLAQNAGLQQFFKKTLFQIIFEHESKVSFE